MILWERLGGEWKKYSWNNRVYDVVAYPNTVALLGFEGTLKVRSRVHGSSVQQLEVSDDAPSTLRSVRCIRRIGDELFVVGMRRMVYRRGFEDTAWVRFDDGVRVPRADDSLAGFSSIDGVSSQRLVAVGARGELWIFQGSWQRDTSTIDADFFVVRRVGERFVIGGNGVVLVGDVGNWQVVKHDDERFVSIECWNARCFVAAESGRTFELKDGALVSLEVEAHRLAATSQRIYFLGHTQLRSLGHEGWRDESPPAALLQE